MLLIVSVKYLQFVEQSQVERLSDSSHVVDLKLCRIVPLFV